MFQTFLLYAMPFTFTLMIACALGALASGVYLFLFRIRPTNQQFRHPYLDKLPWERYPISLRLAILLDYFLRITFPASTFWVAGNANRLLAHVNPAELGTKTKWPLIGLWGGCFAGIIAMILLWVFILLSAV
jgi:sterol desaturase/sphingolipid hydroxylase (fatty acid hydroxylase superfamily)